VDAGLASLGAAGVPPKFLIIDDGWQVRIRGGVGAGFLGPRL
jgi:hypothetical protein